MVSSRHYLHYLAVRQDLARELRTESSLAYCYQFFYAISTGQIQLRTLLGTHLYQRFQDYALGIAGYDCFDVLTAISIEWYLSNRSALWRLLFIVQQYDQLRDYLSFVFGVTHHKFEILFQHLVDIVLRVKFIKHLVYESHQLASSCL